MPARAGDLPCSSRAAAHLPCHKMARLPTCTLDSHVSCLCLPPSLPVCRPMYLLGYLASQSRVYLMDKDFNVSQAAESLSTSILARDPEEPVRGQRPASPAAMGTPWA